MKLSPIILFVYNRPQHTLQTLEALRKCDYAAESHLVIFADGPKENATTSQLQAIHEVRQLIRTKQWCGCVEIIESNRNKGLAQSIVSGVTEIVEKYGRVIVLEDDIVPQKGFLKYMNDALDMYETEEKVMHVSAYMYPHAHSSLPETFFYNLPHPWGWGTWKRAWRHYNDDTDALYQYFEHNQLWDSFNVTGNDYLQKQLEANVRGELKTWFVKWHACNIIAGGLTLYPRYALIYNAGCDGSGVNCGTSLNENGKVINKQKVLRQHVELSLDAQLAIFNFYKFRQLPQTQNVICKIAVSLLRGVYKKLKRLAHPNAIVQTKQNNIILSKLGRFVSIPESTRLLQCTVGDYTYMSTLSFFSNTDIGKCCSIGPRVLCGWGVHPLNGISTAPMFYSTMKQNGITYSKDDKIEEREQITIGNDVFIGADVTILDGVTIGNGAVIGAGAVVSKDIPPYAIAVGNPIRIIRYRFSEEQIAALQRIQWWNWNQVQLKEVEQMFFDIDAFIRKYDL